MASFPGAIYPVPTFGTNLSDVKTHTTWRDEITAEVRAIELELGTTPSGAAATVAARLDDIAWTAYTPVLGGAGWSLGSTGAVAFGAYRLTGNIVHFQARLVFGTVGMTFAATVPTCSLPPIASIEAGSGLPLRSSVFTEYMNAATPVEQVFGVGELLTSTIVALMTFDSAATYVRYGYVVNTIPFTWAASDEIRVAGWYRKA